MRGGLDRQWVSWTRTQRSQLTSFRALPGTWQLTVVVLALLGVSTSGDRSDASVQSAALESENAALRRRLEAPSVVETSPST